MIRRLIPYLAALGVTLTAIISVTPVPAASAPPHTADYVIIAGAAGLRWDDVNATDTPNLWRLAQNGAIGALSVRSAHQPTCPTDGWVTLGAGNYAQRTFVEMEERCPALNPKIDRPDENGAYLPDQQTIVRENTKLPWGAQPGALAESVRCATAVGPGAAIAAARQIGRVDRYAPSLPNDPTVLLSSCVLSVVDLGTVAGEGTARQAAARAADAVLARTVAARPERSTLFIAGLADTDTTSRLHVAVADGPGYARGWLTSSSTGRPGYVQLIDLAATALAVLSREEPPKVFAGAALQRTGGRPARLASAVSRLSDADREASAQRQVAGRFFGLLAGCQLLLLVAVVPLLRRARRGPGPAQPLPVPARLQRSLEVLLVAAALTMPAALLADVVPWWRTGHPGLVFAAVTLTLVAIGTSGIVLSPLGRRTLGPLGAVAAIAALVVGVDVLTGARLQLNGVAGYSALAGVRYAGVGTVGLGVFMAGIMLCAGRFAQLVSRNWRGLVTGAVGGLGVLIVGAAPLGDDAGGAVALTAGVCIAAALAAGGWLTLTRITWAVVTGLAVTAAFAITDLRHPPEERRSLGRFLTELSDGTSGLVVHRTGAQNVIAFATSPLTLLVLGSGLFLGVVLLTDWGGLRRLYGLYPALRGALVGCTVATIAAGFVEGAGLNVAGTAAATAVPLFALAILRVLDHADDRTRPDTNRRGTRLARRLRRSTNTTLPTSEPDEPTPPATPSAPVVAPPPLAAPATSGAPPPLAVPATSAVPVAPATAPPATPAPPVASATPAPPAEPAAAPPGAPRADV